MKNTFTINEKTYVAKEFDFNTVADLDDMGIALADFGKKQLSFMRAYLSICSGLTLEQAGAEINAHMIGGTSLDSMAEAIAKEIDNSAFFHALAPTEEKKNTAKK